MSEILIAQKDVSIDGVQGQYLNLVATKDVNSLSATLNVDLMATVSVELLANRVITIYLIGTSYYVNLLASVGDRLSINLIRASSGFVRASDGITRASNG